MRFIRKLFTGWRIRGPVFDDARRLLDRYEVESETVGPIALAIAQSAFQFACEAHERAGLQHDELPLTLHEVRGEYFLFAATVAGSIAAAKVPQHLTHQIEERLFDLLLRAELAGLERSRQDHRFNISEEFIASSRAKSPKRHSLYCNAFSSSGREGGYVKASTACAEFVAAALGTGVSVQVIQGIVDSCVESSGVVGLSERYGRDQRELIRLS